MVAFIIVIVFVKVLLFLYSLQTALDTLISTVREFITTAEMSQSLRYGICVNWHTEVSVTLFQCSLPNAIWNPHPLYMSQNRSSLSLCPGYMSLATPCVSGFCTLVLCFVIIDVSLLTS